MTTTSSAAELLPALQRIHATIRNDVVAACEAQTGHDLARIERDQEGDTIYAVDRVGEERLVELVAREIGALTPVLLLAEGLPPEGVVLPAGRSQGDTAFRILIDPIDGTRGLMYQKRSAWILSAIAKNRGPDTRLGDVLVALQTEVPLVKQHLSDSLWAVKGQGAHAERFDRLSGAVRPLRLRPSQATTIAHGFAMLSRFFPGAREELAAIDEEIVREALGPVRPGKAHCFEDQYICTGGQLYELIAGHDRFVADLRPLMDAHLRKRGLALGICCHPYDICTELIAREHGVIVTDAAGRPLDAPFDVTSDVAWVGYANQAIRAQIAPLLDAALRRRGLL
jgi:fructose-1,6-bisphosphatase/inositol monophosphatase family enzyme